MVQKSLERLLSDLREDRVSRRAFMRAATAMGVSAGAAGMMARSVAGQEATPDASSSASPVAGAITSITRDEYIAMLEAEYQFEEPQTSGGDMVLVSTADIDSLNPVTRSSVIALYIVNNVYSYIAVQNPIDGTMAPDLADYWEVGADGITYTFYLN